MNARSRRGFSQWRYLTLLVCLFFTLSSISKAQESSGKIVGTIADQSGAVIPGAKVTVTNTGTKVTRDTVTDQDGSFQILSVPVGKYQVSVERTGFKKAATAEQILNINQTLKFDINLEVGSQAEVVDVTAAAALVETSNPTLGQTVSERSVVNLPLNGRNVLNLALLQPGVTETNPGNGSAGGFNIAGGRSDSVEYLLDGGLNNNLLSNAVVFNPNPDAVAEFRILENNYTAEYGRNGGGIISVVTKSGTNQFHGSAYDFVRNNAFNANTFFNNKNGTPKEILKRNQYGFTIGGPVYFLRFGEGGKSIYNGKDKLFFFVSYQGQRQVSTVTTSPVTTFTPAELRGDFSLSNAARTGPDSNVVTFLGMNPIYQPNAALAARGIIARIDPVSQRYISNNLIPTAANGQLISQDTATDNRNEVTVKFDYAPTSKDRFGLTLGMLRNPTLIPFSGGANVKGFPIEGFGNRYFSNIAYTRVFSSNVLNDFRFTVQRSDGLQASPGKNLASAAQLGIGVTPDNPTGPPRISFDSGLTIGFSPQGPTRIKDTTYNITDTFSLVSGKHSFKFGGSFSPYKNDTLYDFYVNGEFDFYGQGGIGSGNDRADFLLGLPDEYLQFGEAPSNIRTNSYYGFAQDEYRIRKNLVLTLGLRYEYSQPKIDTLGRSFSLNMGQRSKVFPNAPLGLQFPGDPGAPKGANFADKNDFAPRFGFAYDPFSDGKTSIRGGFGVFYDILKGEDNLQFNGQAPFFGFTDLGFTAGTGIFSNPFGNAGVPNPFPSRPPSPNIDFGAAGFLPFGGGGVYFVDPNLRTPYVYQYNLSFQHQLARDLTVEANYVGSSSHKLTSLVDANPFILGTTTRRFNAQTGNTSGSFSYLDEFRNVGSANYNGLQLVMRKQYSGRAADSGNFFGKVYNSIFSGSEFTFGYTYSHSIDTASGFRERNSRVPFYNAGQFRASSDYDIRHRLTFSGIFDLPFDRAFSSLPKRLTQGFRVSPIVTYRTGFPLDVFAGLNRSRTSPGPSGAGDPNLVRANLVGNGITIFNDPRNVQTLSDRTGNFYFNPANFSRAGLSATFMDPATNPALNPTLRTYGSLPRNAFRGPSRTNVDLSIAKITPLISERLTMELRAEFFNLFNHAEFNDPVTGITSSNFGQITSTAAPRIIQFAAKFSF
ncbi:MAG: carboxypeptidase regulatory-like domain-containing protein [Pyrinomonadaceae bacterium]